MPLVVSLYNLAHKICLIRIHKEKSKLFCSVPSVCALSVALLLESKHGAFTFCNHKVSVHTLTLCYKQLCPLMQVYSNA